MLDPCLPVDPARHMRRSRKRVAPSAADSHHRDVEQAQEGQRELSWAAPLRSPSWRSTSNPRRRRQGSDVPCTPAGEPEMKAGDGDDRAARTAGG